MRKIWQLFKMDLHRSTMNVIAGIVCLGLVIVPSLYAWFNIAGSWDPYSNTKNLKVAVANTDEGYTSDLMPLSINVGDKVTSALRENDQIGWLITSEQDALEGVRSGQYYAAVIIPPNFSRDLLGMLSADPHTSALDFYVNEKENAIANVVTSKASSALKNQIDTTFAQTVSSVGSSVLGDLGSYLGSDEMTQLANRIIASLDHTQQTLTSTAANVKSYGALVSSAKSLVEGSAGLVDTEKNSTGDLQSALDSASSGVGSLKDALGSASSTVSDALTSGSDSLDSIKGSIDDVFDKAGASTTQVANDLESIAGTLNERKEAVDGLLGGFTAQRDQLQELRDRLEDEYNQDNQLTAAERAVLRSLDRALEASERALASLSAASQSLEELGAEISQMAQELKDGTTSAADAKAKLEGLVEGAKTNLDSAKGTFNDDVAPSLTSLSDAITQSADDAGALKGGLDSTLQALAVTGDSAAQDLGAIQEALDKVSGDLDGASEDVSTLKERLATAVASQDAESIRAILAEDPQELSQFLSAPVDLKRVAVFPVANNGSAMAPMYNSLALWVGAIILVVMLKVEPSKKEEAQLGGLTLTQAYLGRLGIFLVLATLQAALLCAGDLFYLQIQCEHVGLMFLTCILVSLVFTNITYALTVSFGDVGKALAVILMVIQIAGAGGSFPVQMLPAPFQAVYPFLPFVQSMQLMRGCIGGIYGNDFVIHLLGLLGFLAPALILGLVLRRPLVRLNHWIEHQLASTKVM